MVEQKWELEGKPRTWNAFLEEFKKKFILLVIREKREEKIISLRQRTLTVAQYKVQFTKLANYMPDIINSKAKRKRHFLQGLTIEI